MRHANPVIASSGNWSHLVCSPAEPVFYGRLIIRVAIWKPRIALLTGSYRLLFQRARVRTSLLAMRACNVVRGCRPASAPSLFLSYTEYREHCADQQHIHATLCRLESKSYMHKRVHHEVRMAIHPGDMKQVAQGVMTCADVPRRCTLTSQTHLESGYTKWALIPQQVAGSRIYRPFSNQCALLPSPFPLLRLTVCKFTR